MLGGIGAAIGIAASGGGGSTQQVTANHPSVTAPISPNYTVPAGRNYYNTATLRQALQARATTLAEQVGAQNGVTVTATVQVPQLTGNQFQGRLDVTAAGVRAHEYISGTVSGDGSSYTITNVSDPVYDSYGYGSGGYSPSGSY